jgi:nitronate monooxygenase
MIDNTLTRMLGITAPVVQAPIGPWPELVAAVSAAGGLGLIQGTWLDERTLKQLINATRALTDEPFGVNLVLDQDRRLLLDVALAEGVAVITFAGGDPEPYLEPAHAGGAVVTHTVGGAEEAQRVAAAGVDAVVAQGWEAGGHVHGEVASFSLIPAVKGAVGDIPVIAAGGIADGRGLAAAMALGADGVWMGTRFVACEEARFTRAYKQSIVAASAEDSVRTTLFDIGWPDSPHRVLRNSTYRRWEASGRPQPGRRPGEGEVLAVTPDGEELVRYGIVEPTTDLVGDVEALAQYAGQSTGLVDGVESAAEIVTGTVAEAEAILRRLAEGAMAL